MKLRNIQKVISGALGVTVLLGLPACTDDHYDIKQGGDTTASKTLWQNIEETPQLDSLAMILKRVKVYTKEEDQKRTITYADLLGQSQFFTFWAPLNGTYNAKAYLDQLDQMDELNAAGNIEDANKLEYTIGLQFAQNHMARYNYESNKDEQEVRLYNGKLTTYNSGAGTFNGLKVDDKVVGSKPSSNGMLHVIDGQSQFVYNIFDYMEANADIFSEVYGTLSDPKIDTLIFNESASTPGGMNANGQMVYVDSVFTNRNEILDDSRAQIKNEDSLYVAVIPTDAAWAEAYAKVEKLFNYGTEYNYDYANDEMNFRSEYEANADSLRDYNTRYTLLTSMYFSPSIFPERYDRTQLDEIKQYALYADSLISTNGVVYHNYAGAGNRNPLFGNVEPVTASNGIIYPLTSYDMDPSYSFMAAQEIDMQYASNIGATILCAGGNQGVYATLTQGNNWDTDIDISMLEDKGYRYFEKSGTTMNVYIPIRNLYSGKYRIRIHLLPNRVDINHKWYDNDGEEIMQETRFQAALYDDHGSLIGEATDDITVSDDEVKVYTLWESIEIPKCYVGLPSGIDNSFPMLELTVPRQRNNRYTAGLSIYKIYIDPVHE